MPISFVLFCRLGRATRICPTVRGVALGLRQPLARPNPLPHPDLCCNSVWKFLDDYQTYPKIFCIRANTPSTIFFAPVGSIVREFSRCDPVGRPPSSPHLMSGDRLIILKEDAGSIAPTEATPVASTAS